MHTYILTYRKTYRYLDMQTYRHANKQTYRHTDMHTFIHICTYTCTYMYIYIHITSHGKRMYVGMSVCMYGCMYACTCARERDCFCWCLSHSTSCQACIVARVCLHAWEGGVARFICADHGASTPRLTLQAAGALFAYASVGWCQPRTTKLGLTDPFGCMDVCLIRCMRISMCMYVLPYVRMNVCMDACV